MLFVFIFVLSALAGFVLPWWAIVVIAFVAALFLGKHSSQAIWSGFGGVFAAWVLLALLKSVPNDNLLASRVAGLFHLPHWMLLLLIMGIIGGLVGGLAALSGFLVKQVFIKPKAA